MIHTIAELRETIDAARGRQRRLAAPRGVALVATMGALHSGHLRLVERAREIASFVVVSIFVNPLQFGVDEDCGRYPQMVNADRVALEAAGVDAIFAPSNVEVYPGGRVSTRIVGGAVASLFEGVARPGHFDGVLTVVGKLFNIVQPDVAVFGQKDAQQVFLVQQMVGDLNYPVRIDVVETVRERDGLAFSSRNRFLDPGERRASTVLFGALEAAKRAADGGVNAVIAAAQSVLMGESYVKMDYLAVVNPRTFLPVDDHYRGLATVLIAARLGTTRLIDNDRVYLN